jgi:hypothetical protein
MLRLAHPAPRGQGTDPPKRRKGRPSPSLSLTPDEARHLRASIRNVARVHFGTLIKLANAIGVAPRVLTRKAGLPSAGLALAVARVSGVSLDAMLGRVALAAVPTPPALLGGAS